MRENRFAQYPQVNFRAGELEPALSARGESLALVARRDLERYYQLLTDELQAVQLSEGEAGLIVDALNGTLLDAHSYRYLPAEIMDALNGTLLTDKWAVDGEALTGKLARLSRGQLLAVVDAAERYWQRAGQAAGQGEPLPEQLRAVGLLR